MKEIAALVTAAFAALFFIIFLFSTWFTVGQGERGVITHYGAVAGLAEPGLGFKLPFITAVHDINIQVQQVEWHKASDGDSRMAAYSHDQQPATVALAVNWHITDPLMLYSSYGSPDNFSNNIIQSKAMEVFKNVFGQYDAADAIGKREKLNAEVTAALQAAIKGTPAAINSVQVEDIEFSHQYEKAVEDRMEAQVREQQTVAQKAQRITAADAAKYEVEAQADAAQYAGQAEAKAIQAKGDALRSNPEIVSLTAAQKWDGVLPTTMIPGGSVPFLNLGK